MASTVGRRGDGGSGGTGWAEQSWELALSSSPQLGQQAREATQQFRVGLRLPFLGQEGLEQRC